jgi:hypothetical protein
VTSASRISLVFSIDLVKVICFGHGKPCGFALGALGAANRAGFALGAANRAVLLCHDRNLRPCSRVY